jgi:pSer/pThr/pTyr-binding forkhead associated (FHA) protein
MPVADPSRTAKIPSAPEAAKTQMFMSLGADLVAEKGPDKGREFPLHKPVTTIGRAGARSNDVEVSDDTVSKDQASIYYDGARKTFSIANESGTNPTKVNGQQISGPTQLDHGSVIEMGRTAFRFKKS